MFLPDHRVAKIVLLRTPKKCFGLETVLFFAFSNGSLMSLVLLQTMWALVLLRTM